MTGRSGTSEVREQLARLRPGWKGLRIWRVWDRILENEFLDRGIALSGKAFVSFPLVIVVPALSTNTRNNPGRAGGPDHRHP
jgi:hypothetical protein